MRRGKGRLPGVMTVFFALLAPLFLGFSFMLIESARFQGARSQAANITDMGNYSIFGEYERELLTRFEIFGLDGARGSGDFSIGRVNDLLRTYLQMNASPASYGLAAFCLDPWRLSLRRCAVTKYALLTDRDCESFFQQAVSFMRETAVTQTAGKLFLAYQDAQTAQRKQETYEQERRGADQELAEAERREREKKEELRQQALRELQETGTTTVTMPRITVTNPIPALRSLARKGMIKIACGDAAISSKKVSRSDQVSSRSLQRGNLTLPSPHQGLINQLYFREYLLEHFGNYRSGSQDGKLSYEIEYILGGRRSDRDNLKAVITRLLVLREGSNYLTCSRDPVMSGEAEGMALLLVGWTGIPSLVSVLKHALLLGWAYGESLLDVRAIMSGGSVPLDKQGSEWRLSLSSLHRINELLESAGAGSGRGLDYRGYLRLLLNLQGIRQQKRRGMDLVEMRVRMAPGMSSFRADHCLVAVKDETSWAIPPLFSTAGQIFFRISGQTGIYEVNGGFSYETM